MVSTFEERDKQQFRVGDVVTFADSPSVPPAWREFFPTWPSMEVVGLTRNNKFNVLLIKDSVGEGKKGLAAGWATPVEGPW